MSLFFSTISFSIRRAALLSPPFLKDLPFITGLSDESRLLTLLAGHLSSGNQLGLQSTWAYLPEHLHAQGVEALLLGIQYAGIPRTLNAFTAVQSIGILDKVVKEKRPFLSITNDANDIDLSVLKNEQNGMRDDGILKQRMDQFNNGDKLLSGWKLSGYARLRKHLRLLHPLIDRLIVSVGHGRLLGRDVLSSRDANLVNLMGFARQIKYPQFRAYLQDIIGNKLATVEEVRGILDQCASVFSSDTQAHVDSVWSNINVRRFEKEPIVDESAEKYKKFIWSYEYSPSQLSQEIFNERCITYSKNVNQNLFGKPHPYLVTFRRPNSLSEPKLICALLAANSQAGNLSRVAMDWSYLPKEFHRMGLEAILQSSVFGGLLGTINALETVHSIGVDQSAINFQYEDDLALECPTKTWRKGLSLMSSIYTKMLAPLLSKLNTQHPDLASIIVDYAYGQILSRECPGVTAADRELWSLACLSDTMSLPQLYSHMLGALHCGATMQEIRCMLDQVESIHGKQAQSSVDSFWLDFERNAHKKH